MKPTDLRNATWRDVLTHLTDDLVRVHLAWQAHGPGTTREIAQKSGISLLTFRPRTTDLYKLGLVVLVDSDSANGIYAARTHEQAELSRAWQTRADFRRSGSHLPAPCSLPPAPPACPEQAQRVERAGFPTVEAAIASLSPADQAALGAKLMGKWGHLGKRREALSAAGTQLSLLPA